MPIIPKSFTGTICCWMLPSRLVPPCTVPVAGPLVSDLPGMGMARASGRSAQARQGCRLLQRRCGTGHLRGACPVSGTGRAAGRAYRIFFQGTAMFRLRQCLCRGTASLNRAFAASAGMIRGRSCPRNLGAGHLFLLWRKREPRCVVSVPPCLFSPIKLE